MQTYGKRESRGWGCRRSRPFHYFSVAGLQSNMQVHSKMQVSFDSTGESKTSLKIYFSVQVCVGVLGEGEGGKRLNTPWDSEEKGGVNGTLAIACM